MFELFFSPLQLSYKQGEKSDPDDYVSHTLSPTLPPAPPWTPWYVQQAIKPLAVSLILSHVCIFWFYSFIYFAAES